jgi:hypothetical protein
VIFVPPQSRLEALPVRTRYAFNDSRALAQRAKYYVERQNDFAGKAVLNSLITSSISQIANLTNVDGALILDGDFGVLAFGAKLIALPWNGNCRIGPGLGGIVSGDAFPIDRYGTRHRSAVDFVAAVEHSMAFVLSADGPVRAFTKANADIVFCWPDVLDSYFIDRS